MLSRIIRLCVNRRLAGVVFALVLGAYGFHAYLRTPIEAYPDVTNVQVNVIAQLPGLAPEEIERQLTIPLERELNGTPGMTMLRSESLFGLSLIWAIFEDGTDSFRARSLISERLANAEIPEEASAELAPDYTPLGKVFYYRLTSDRHTLHEIRAEQEWTVSRVLSQVPGIAEVGGLGGYLREFHVEVSPSRLQAHGLALADVSEALEESNINVGGGFLAHGEQEMVVRGIGYITGADDIRDVVLDNEGGVPVTLGDVGRIIESHTPRRGTVGHTTAAGDERDIVMGIALLRRGENPSVVLDGLHDKVDQLNNEILPDGMRIETIYDRSELIAHTMHTVHHNLFHGAILVIGIVWLFLRSLRGSLIVATVIPASLLAAFTGLYLLDLPANLISMGAIDFGILVGGAVVLVENVVAQAQKRRPENAKEMRRLVVSSAVDVSRPTFYAMAIIIAALIPVFTLESVEGRIFRPLALTYAFAMAGALVFTLTIVPALCAMIMKPDKLAHDEPKFVHCLRAGYGWMLQRALGARPLVIAAALGVLAIAGLTFTKIGTEFLPELDEGDIYVFTEMPASISLEKGQEILTDMREILVEFPEVVSVTSEQGRPEDGTDNEGINMSKDYVRLIPRDDWRAGLTKGDLVEEMRVALRAIPGVDFSFSQPIRDSIEEAVAGVRGQVVLKIYGPDLTAMRATLLESISVLENIPGVVELGLYRDSVVPQLQVRIDRQALAREGISMEMAQSHVETALAGRVATEFWDQERPVPVRVRLPYEERADPTRIGAIAVPNAAGGFVPLEEIADISVAEGLTFIPREQNIRYLALSFNVDGRDMGSVITDAIAAVDEAVEVPEGHRLEWGGEFENQQRAQARLLIIVPVALVIIFFLLYGALVSLRGAFMVLLTAPIGITGGLFALYFTGVELSVSAAIGFIALLGQVALLGLLVLSGIENRRREGTDKHTGIIEGATSRFRAVLLDALLAAFGLLPMAISTGLGSETQRPFALVLVGGMVTVFLTAVFVLPVVYSWISPRELKPIRTDDDHV